MFYGLSGLCWHVKQKQGGSAFLKGLNALGLLIGECLDIGENRAFLTRMTILH